MADTSPIYDDGQRTDGVIFLLTPATPVVEQRISGAVTAQWDGAS
ncbi:hypothetical protein GCM10010503_35600 [Streptomyces lucensis JCM 4490]|uniref:Uncharacterized protein n=1 Tax=Streptomyces lucensis JCM 4490 TaxID=1306176 RepID=A0A918MRW1_9ACTN|nr:hypothetical protein [Streptomyces lucensis]GGW55425.1 hypothetical protein GCM10010503_35600 [Streptomyces lucensis JCM 4490]